MPRAMDAQHDGSAGEDPADAQATASSDDGEHRGVHFGAQQGFSGLGDRDLGRPRRRHPFGRPQGRGETSGRPFPAMEHDHDGGAPAGRRGPDDAEGPLAVVFVVVRVDLRWFRHANGGAVAMRSAALLAMFLAATALVGGDTGVSRPSQFRALMLWLGGCIGLFLSRR